MIIKMQQQEQDRQKMGREVEYLRGWAYTWVEKEVDLLPPTHASINQKNNV